MMDIILFNAVAIILIAFIIIWFWLIRGQSTSMPANALTIRVKNGVYSPNRIQTTQTTLTLNFIRKDASPCAEYVAFEQLNISERLPLNEAHAIVLNHLKPGHYRFTCQMGMYQGELIVEQPRNETD